MFDAFETHPVSAQIGRELFGRMPIQVGRTGGHCRKMNALEYHKSSEVNVADRKVILFPAAVNKWLISHLDGGFAANTRIGITGDNLEV